MADTNDPNRLTYNTVALPIMSAGVRAVKGTRWIVWAVHHCTDVEHLQRMDVL